MFSHVPVIPKGKNFGPAMRVWGIAKALQKRGHNITIAVKNKEKKETFQKVEVIPLNPDLLKKIENYDVAFVHPWFNDSDYLKKLSQIPLIVDLYAPYLIEHLYYDYNQKKDGEYRYADDIWFSTLAPIQYGDYFICASERQKKYYLGILAACGRLNPKNVNSELIDVVPFGVSKNFKLENKKVLKKKIQKNKKIILWMSAFYNWLNPVKTAKIMKELNKINKDYVLAVVGAKSPFVHYSMYEKNYEKFTSYVKKNKLKNIYMFDWLDSEDIASVYNESDLFIVTYENSLETLLSYRVRMMNALMGKLPVISEKGDVVSEMIEKNNLGLIFDNKSPKEIAEKISNLQKSDIKKIKNNIKKFLPYHYWEKIIDPIDNFCKNPKKDNSKESFKFSKFLDERRELTIQLRNEIDEKKGHIKNLDKSLKNQRNEFEKLIENKEKKIEFLDIISKRQKGELTKLKKILDEKDNEINLMILNSNKLNKLISEKDNELSLSYEKINNLNMIIEQKKTLIGKFRKSIVYPFYKITSSIGKTKIGKTLQKILK